MNRPTSWRLKQIITNAIATCIVNGATPEGWHNLNVPEPRTQYVLLPPFSPAVVFFFGSSRMQDMRHILGDFQSALEIQIL